MRAFRRARCRSLVRTWDLVSSQAVVRRRARGAALRARGLRPHTRARPASVTDTFPWRCACGSPRKGGVCRHAPGRYCSCSPPPRASAPPASWARLPCRSVPATRATWGRRCVAKRVQARAHPPLRERRARRGRAPALCGCGSSGAPLSACLPPGWLRRGRAPASAAPDAR